MSLERISFAEALTFSRAGEAAFFGSNGLLQTAAAGVPRFDYDPVTLAPKGILIEGTRDHLLIHNESLDNAIWSKEGATVVANAAIAPTGNMTADELVENTATSQHNARRLSVAVTVGTRHVFSTFVKRGVGTRDLVLRVEGIPTEISWGRFDLTTGTASTFGTAALSVGMYSVGNGWFFCWVVVAADDDGTVAQVKINTANGPLVSYTGDGVSSLYVWRPTLSPGTFPSASITTTTMPITTAADILTVNPATFAAAFRQDAGTILIDLTLNHTGLTAAGGNDFPFLLDMDSSAAPGDGYTMVASAGYGPGYQLSVTTGGVSQAQFSITKALGGGSRTKLALTWGGANDFAACMDGGTVLTDTSGTIPTPDRLSIGCQDSSGNQMFGHVREVLFFPNKFTGTQLQEATTL